MAATSFRDILAQFLDEKTDKTTISPSEKPQFAPPRTDFHWQGPEFQGKRRSLYPAAPPRTQTPPLEVKPVSPRGKPLEPEWNLIKFTAQERECVTNLIEMGAFELKGKESITRSLLKTAHRRLVKLHHPDVLIKVVNEKERAHRKEAFLKLQASVERLNACITALSASACDNESASVSESRHQDAA